MMLWGQKEARTVPPMGLDMPVEYLPPDPLARREERLQAWVQLLVVSALINVTILGLMVFVAARWGRLQ